MKMEIQSTGTYALYKFPKIHDHSDSRIANGVAYDYITQKPVDQGWILSNNSIGHPESIPGRSIEFLFSKKSDILPQLECILVGVGYRRKKCLRMNNFNLEMKNLLFIVCFLVYFEFCVCSLQCLDETGETVDWYVLYKLPKLRNHPDPKIARGMAYAFITSETTERGWQLSKKTVLDPESFFGRSLSYLYSPEVQNDVDDHFWIFYNDQPLNEPVTEIDGHTKGLVAGNSEGGFWLVHSLPKFPVVNVTRYTYPKTGFTFGQNFLCISMQKEVLDSVGNQLITNWAHVFNSSFTPKLANMYPSLAKAARNERTSDIKRKEIIRSSANNQFISFAKSSKFNAELYSDWLSDYFRSELYVESWLHKDNLPSACNRTYKVYNIADVTITNANCEFGNWHDHSKFAVSANSSHWVCIGDINRTSTQATRGGGTVCLNNQKLWTAYHSMIQSIEQCPKVGSMQ